MPLHQQMLAGGFAGAVENYFSDNFKSCRTGFLQSAKMIESDSMETRFFPLSNHDGSEAVGELGTDCLWLGSKDAAKVMVFISGTHGVEGYCGSAAQRYLLDQIAKSNTSLPKDLAIVMLHGLNPWGMQWARRCDQNGIDLNRNFVDFSAMPVVPEEYPLLLNCLELPDITQRQQALAVLREAWGDQRYDQIVSGGQYSQAWAPFYGGTAPSQASAVIDAVIADYNLAEREVVVIDVHSGLGPYGHGELISDHPLDSRGNASARNVFGAAVAVTAEGASFSVPKEGLLDYRWHQLMQNQGFFLTLEFGSYGTEALFNVISEDHLLWRGGALNTSEFSQQRAAMVEHFCPSDRLWRQSVLFKSWQVLDQLLRFYQ